MRQLGQAMMIYASVNAGRFPDRLDRLLAYVPSSALVCPSTSDTPAAGQSPQAQTGNLAKPGHLSYVYVGDAYSTNALVNSSTTIVMYEPLANHADGTNVLYADGHVTYLPAAVVMTSIPGLKSATPSLGPGGPTTAPATQSGAADGAGTVK
jgi:prepilin-type processing-associated H-X9-DG protein